MSVKKDDSGRRWVEAEVEVPGTPEEVWRAIATGPGISSWFVPTEAEEREGGKLRCNFGPGMESVATITVWDPPHRTVAESQDLGPEAPPMATEWTVEARSGGTCIVRVVHSLFASGDDWDDQLEGAEAGWPDFFRILRLVLTHFTGQPSAAFQSMGTSSEPRSDAWAALTGALGFRGARTGERVESTSAAPRLAGLVERVGEEAHPEELLLRLEEPAPGVAHLFALEMGGQTFLSMRAYLFGASATSTVEREEDSWRAWMAEQFPSASESGGDAPETRTPQESE